jgi:transposase
MRYIGANVQNNCSLFAVLAQEGKVKRRTRFENNPQALRKCLGGLPRPAPSVMEAGYRWEPLYEVVEELGLAVSLAQPLRVRLMAEARIQIDTIDAATVAHLLPLNYLPTASIPPRDMRDLREMLRHRVRLAKTQAMVKNRIHSERAHGLDRLKKQWYNGSGSKYALGKG